MLRKLYYWIGRRLFGIQGYISDVKCYPRMLTKEEVKEQHKKDRETIRECNEIASRIKFPETVGMAPGYPKRRFYESTFTLPTEIITTEKADELANETLNYEVNHLEYYSGDMLKNKTISEFIDSDGRGNPNTLIFKFTDGTQFNICYDHIYEWGLMNSEGTK
jgi:hypothetical protein